jgi:MFS family permease
MHGAGTVSVLFVTMVLQTVVSMMSLTPPVVAEDVVATLGLPAGAAGFYTGLIYFFVLLTNSVSAPLTAWLGPLRLSFACIVLAGLGLALFGTGSIVGVLFATTVIGLSYGPLTPASSQVLAAQSQSQSFALLVSVRQTSVPLGGVLAGLLVPQLVLRLGWQSSCVVLGLGTAMFAFVTALSLPLIRKEQPAGRTRFSGGLLGPLRFITQRRDLLTLSAASTIFGALQLVLSAFLVIYLVTVVGHDLVSAGALLGLSQVSGVLGRILWGYVADRIRSPRKLLGLVGVGMALACFATGLLAYTGPSWLAIPVVILFGATASGWNGVFLAEVMREVKPAEVGFATSGSLMFTYFGVMIGPPLFGVAAAFVEFQGAYAFAAVLALAGAYLAWRTGPGRL